MSWAADEWKDGLPPQALQKISQLETQLTKFKKDRDQKQCQLESLEVVSTVTVLTFKSCNLHTCTFCCAHRSPCCKFGKFC